MEKFKDFRKSGSFRLASGVEVPGELSLKGGATSLDLYSDAFFDTHASEDIAGTFHDRSKVSLIGCITTTVGNRGTRVGEDYHFCSVFPHFALIGDEHITSGDRKIAGVSFAVDDASSIFYDFDAFGSATTDARQHMERIVEDKKDLGRTIEIGEHPLIFYFTGKYDIFAVDTVLGRRGRCCPSKLDGHLCMPIRSRAGGTASSSRRRCSPRAPSRAPRCRRWPCRSA